MYSWAMVHQRFCERKHRQSTLSGFRHDCFLLTMFPAELNSYSEGTEVAGKHKNVRASAESILYQCSLCFHQSKGSIVLSALFFKRYWPTSFSTRIIASREGEEPLLLSKSEDLAPSSASWGRRDLQDVFLSSLKLSSNSDQSLVDTTSPGWR